MSNNREASLTIGDLAQRTGVAVATLRAWESRHGYPEPHRLASGHRRYRLDDVARIEQLQRDRRSGLSLEAAIERARRPPDRPTPSVFAGLRRRHPDLQAHVLTKRTMNAISRAIEDESLATAGRAVLVGSFQRERFYRRSEMRWKDLAQSARCAVVFADFSTTRAPREGPVEVALPGTAPMGREWAVVCFGGEAKAVLAGRERAGQGRTADGRRRFEAVWSVEPAVVGDAMRIGLELARSLAPALVPADLDVLAPDGEEPALGLRRATSLTNRIVAYLDE